MKTSSLRMALFSGVFAVLAGVSGSAAAQAGQHEQHGQHGMVGQDMMKPMQDMHRKMESMQMTGDPDHDFATMMRSHHQAGVDMANIQLKNGKDPQMTKMAKKMVSEQTKEIKKLDDWLAKHPAQGK